MYLIIVFMVSPCLLGRRIWLCPIIAPRQTGVATADPHSTLPLAGIRLHGPSRSDPLIRDGLREVGSLTRPIHRARIDRVNVRAHNDLHSGTNSVRLSCSSSRNTDE